MSVDTLKIISSRPFLLLRTSKNEQLKINWFDFNGLVERLVSFLLIFHRSPLTSYSSILISSQSKLK